MACTLYDSAEDDFVGRVHLTTPPTITWSDTIVQYAVIPYGHPNDMQAKSNWLYDNLAYLAVNMNDLGTHLDTHCDPHYGFDDTIDDRSVKMSFFELVHCSPETDCTIDYFYNTRFCRDMNKIDVICTPEHTGCWLHNTTDTPVYYGMVCDSFDSNFCSVVYEHRVGTPCDSYYYSADPGYNTTFDGTV